MSKPETNALRERAKELRCLYRIQDVLRDRSHAPVRVFSRVLEEIPAGWQRPEAAGARIEYLGRSYVGPGFSSRSPHLSEPIRVWGAEVGRLEVSDSTERPDPRFLPEESELLHNIASRLGEYLEWKQTELLGGRPSSADHWRWREGYVAALAAHLDTERFGDVSLFLGGSTETGDAGPASDIDLFLDFEGTEEQRQALATWLEGWSLCLAEVAHQQTGYPFEGGILDVHWLPAPPSRHERTKLRSVPTGRLEGPGPTPAT